MNTKEQGQRVKRRCIFFQPDVEKRLSNLAERGVMYSSAVNYALLRTLTTIEKQIETGKTIPGLRVRKGR
jgi:hypothetical protein